MKQTTVLVIDDDPGIRFILAKYVRGWGHKVCEATNGEDAYSLLTDPASPVIDLVLTDLWMPHMSGIDLLRSVRALRPDLPIAVITGSATLDTSIAALNLGAYAYLTKPLQKEQIHDVISRGLVKREEFLAYHTSPERLSELDSARSQADRMVEELIRGLRHELGNAATAIKLNLSVLEEQKEAVSPRLKEHLRDLEESTDHIVSLLAKLREYPKHGLATELIDLREVLTSTIGVVRRDADPSKIWVNYSLPHDEILIHGASLDLCRAFVHIVENAVEAQGNDPHVQIDIATSEDLATVTVSDNGPGFPAAMLEQSFSPGYTTKVIDGVVRGLGFGLFIARAVIEMHGGRIWLENRAEGGASVHVELPLARDSQVLPQPK